jgi:hypothetical protein
MVSDWIDYIPEKISELSYRGKSIRSFLVYKKTEIPDKLEPEDIPAAVTYLIGSSGDYSAGGAWEYWTGQTDFYLENSTAKELYNQVLDFHPLIRNKLLENIQFAGLVDEFRLIEGETESSIRGPVELQYNEEAPFRWGYTVRWRVKENVSTEVTIAA